MSSTFTTNAHLELQGTGDNSGTWGAELNTAVFTIVDNVFGAVTTVSLSNVDVTLTTTQTQANAFVLSGVLSANVNVIFPAIGRTYFITNNCTGAFTASIKVTGQTAVVVPQGSSGFWVLDGTNISHPTPMIGTSTSLASAATTDLGLIGTHNVNVTGTTGITSFGSSANVSSPVYLVTFAGALTITHGSALLLPNQANLTTVANGRALMMYLGSGNWVMLSYMPPGEAAFPIFGNCRLLFTSSTVVTLTPFQGNQITFPSGVTARIPSAGITSTITNAYVNGTAAQTLAATTLQYAYLWNQGTAAAPNFVIDWSTTGHVTDATTGIEIKSGDATRVLIGMAYPQTGPVFSDIASARLVATWFNRRYRSMLNAFTVNRSTGSQTLAEVNSEIRLNFICWGDEGVRIEYAGYGGTGGAVPLVTGISLDGSTSAGVFFSTSDTPVGGGYQVPQPVAATFAPAEGFHYATVFGAVPQKGTGTWFYTGGNAGSGQLTGGVDG